MGNIGSELHLPYMLLAVKDQHGRGSDAGDPIQDLFFLSLSEGWQMLDIIRREQAVVKILDFHILSPIPSKFN